MKRANVKRKKMWMTGGVVILVLLVAAVTTVYAQDGNAGITEATNKVKSYFATGANLMYAIGAVTGLVGAVKV